MVSILIWSLIIGMKGSSVGCEAMYRFIMSSGVSGLLDILKTNRYGDMFLDVGILVIFLLEYMFWWIMVWGAASNVFVGNRML